MSQISDRYATAFLELVKEENKVSDAKKQAKVLVECIDDDVIHFLSINSIGNEEKKKLIREWFAKCDLEFVHLLCLLVDARRINYASEILKDFISKCNEELGILEVHVTSAHALKDVEKEKIVNAISQKYKRQVELYESVNEELLAGVKINIEGRVIDSTLRRRVDDMKKELLKEGW